MTAPTPPADRFRVVYETVYADLLRFVQRRVATGAEDVVAEAMTVAWRRVDELPEPLDEARAWLFGIARGCLLNERRAQTRQGALGVRLAGVETYGDRARVPDAADDVAARVDVTRAFGRLDLAEQEVLALTVLDGLTSEHAGRVLGISAVAYRHRLSRARAALRRELDAPAVARSAVPAATTRVVGGPAPQEISS